MRYESSTRTMKAFWLLTTKPPSASASLPPSTTAARQKFIFLRNQIMFEHVVKEPDCAKYPFCGQMIIISQVTRLFSTCGPKEGSAHSQGPADHPFPISR